MGRTKLIGSPEIMWNLFCKYKETAKSKPILVQDFVGKDGQEVRRERERPLTMEGFECFVWDEGVAEGVEQYFSNREGRYADFVGICTRIRREIRQDQISGGMAGIYNPSITQRLNGLVEKAENKVDGIQKIIVEYSEGNTPETT